MKVAFCERIPAKEEISNGLSNQKLLVQLPLVKLPLER